MKNHIFIFTVVLTCLVPCASRARYVDADIGRFTTMDTYAGNNNDPLSLHKYLYAEDNPANMVDPSGHEGDLIGVMMCFFALETLDSIGEISLTPGGNPQVLNVFAVTDKASIPDYGRGLKWTPSISGKPRDDIGPHDDDPKGSYTYTLWIVFEGQGLDNCKVFRDYNKTTTLGIAGTKTSGSGFQAGGAKLDTSKPYERDATPGNQFVTSPLIKNGDSAWIVEDAPGFNFADNAADYPLSYQANFLVQLKYEDIVLADAWYDVVIKANSEGDHTAVNSVKLNGTDKY
jgi:RHS repeat-associated protein